MPTRSTAITSNPGHSLWSGIVPKDRAARLVAVDAARHVERLGIRTLSASGAVWPHDNAIIALGFRHYGFAAEAGGRKFTSQVAEIATTWAGSVTLWIRVNNSYNLRAGVTQNRARTVLLPTFL
jgi:glycogen debranching enzyme